MKADGDGLLVRLRPRLEIGEQLMERDDLLFLDLAAALAL